jgi:hypothetical protein
MCKFRASFQSRIQQVTIDDVQIRSVKGQASCSNERYLLLFENQMEFILIFDKYVKAQFFVSDDCAILGIVE